MIEVTQAAQAYFAKLIAQQGADGLGLHLAVAAGGTPRAECELNFCQLEDVNQADQRITLDGFDLYVDAASSDYLVDAEMDYKTGETGGELVVRAPNIKGQAPADDAPLVERVQYVLDCDVNPMVASHGGNVSLVEITAKKEVVLQFGGGCHGCGMVSVTLKQGVETTFMQKIPEITAVLDATDHSTGENPYYSAAQ